MRSWNPVASHRVVGLTLLALVIHPGLEADLLPPAKHAPASTPKLAVLIAVDGLSQERLMVYWPWYVSGFKRLLDQGLVETECHYQHLNTETGPGHSSLGTGAPPRVTGIVANKWFETDADGSLRSIYCTDQPGARALAGPGNLRVPTFADRLVESRPGSRVFSIGGKNRASILVAGRNSAHIVYWFDQDTGRFVSSPAYAVSAAADAIVKDFNRTQVGGMLPARLGLLWRKLPLPPGSERLPKPAGRLADFQVPVLGLGFDHDLSKHPLGYFTGIYTSPLADELVADLALALLNDDGLKIGSGTDPDVLWVTFPAQDTVSHNYGAESEENLDVLRRLDLQVGRFFDVLDRKYRREDVVVALSADHGFTVIPEAEKARNKSFNGGRLVAGGRAMTAFVTRLNRLLDDELCLARWDRPIYGSEGWTLYYNRPAFPLQTVEGTCGPPGRTVNAPEVDAVLPKILARDFAEEIEAVLLTSQKTRWSKTDPHVSFALNDFDRERSGEAFLFPRSGVLMHWDPGRGTGHGSHHDYDTHVPLVFWGGDFKPGYSAAETTPYDLAPTLADYFGISLPDGVGESRRLRPAGPRAEGSPP